MCDRNECGSLQTHSQSEDLEHLWVFPHFPNQCPNWAAVVALTDDAHVWFGKRFYAEWLSWSNPHWDQPVDPPGNFEENGPILCKKTKTNMFLSEIGPLLMMHLSFSIKQKLKNNSDFPKNIPAFQKCPHRDWTKQSPQKQLCRNTHINTHIQNYKMPLSVFFKGFSVMFL